MTGRVVVPTQSYADWQRLLAKPQLHWKTGYSAMTLARSWEAAQPSVPPEIRQALEGSGAPCLQGLELLLAIPEYQVALPGGQRASQTDVLALVRNGGGLVAVAVEGKVDEPFGPTIGGQKASASSGAGERLRFLADRLGLPGSTPETVRYQLLHRTVSALIAAEQFHASAAVMLVHSFSPAGKWFDDFSAFAALFGVRAAVGEAMQVRVPGGTPLYIGWCKGDQRFREEARI